MKDTKITEWRPAECGTRIADVIMRADGIKVLRTKCRRCSKDKGVDVFHDIAISV